MTASPAFRRAAGAVVVVLTALVFGQVAGFRFVYWDDYYNFVLNTAFRKEWTTAADWGYIFDVQHVVRFQPVAWLVYKAVDVLWGMNAGAFHVANLVVHMANAGLFFAVLLRLRPERAGARAVALAGVVALAWAVNPLRAEPVAWATDLPYMLATLFFLGSLLAYLRYEQAGARGAARWWLAGAVGLFLLAMSSYPLPLTWPLALPLVAVALRMPTGPVNLGAVVRESRKSWVATALMLAPAAVVVAVTVYDRTAYKGMVFKPVGVDASAWIGRLEHIVVVPPYFVYKFLAPFGLSPVHFAECDAVGWALAAFAGIFWIGFLFLLLRWRTNLRALLWFCVYLVVCIPVMNLTEPVLIPPDRYAHLANLVMLMGVYDCVAGAAWVERKFTVVMLGLGAWVACSLALCWAQVGVWKDSYTLFTYLEAQPCVQEHADLRYEVQSYLAAQLTVDGRNWEAVAQYKDYAQHHGVDAAVLHQLGLNYFELGQYAHALLVLKEAETLMPNPLTEGLIQQAEKKQAEETGASPGTATPAAKP